MGQVTEPLWALPAPEYRAFSCKLNVGAPPRSAPLASAPCRAAPEDFGRFFVLPITPWRSDSVGAGPRPQAQAWGLCAEKGRMGGARHGAHLAAPHTLLAAIGHDSDEGGSNAQNYSSSRRCPHTPAQREARREETHFLPASFSVNAKKRKKAKVRCNCANHPGAGMCSGGQWLGYRVTL